MQQTSHLLNEGFSLETSLPFKNILFRGSLPIRCSPRIVQCSPFPDSASLIAYGGETYIAVMVRQRGKPSPEEPTTSNNWEVKSLVELHHDGRVECVAWSPLSIHSTQETVISLCAGSSDRKLRYYFANLTNKESQFVLLEGHTDYVNACVFSPLSLGLLVASVSDDHTCRIWDVETQQEISRLLLKSAGISVSWHNKLPNQILVGEHRGVLKMFDLRSNTTILTLYTAEVPLHDVDWNPLNPNLIGAAVGGNNWYLWSGVMTQTGRPLCSKNPVHTAGVRKFRWSLVNEDWFATIGGQGTVSIWDKTQPKVPLTHQNSIKTGGISWIYGEPYLVTGGDQQLHFWLVGGPHQ